MKNLLFLFLFLGLSTQMNAQESTAPKDAKDICPTLIGEDFPNASLMNTEGEVVDIATLTAEKPSIFIFYRGSWCPYCNSQLAGVQEIEADLKDLGYQVIGVSPDLPENLKKSVDKSELSYTLLSDNRMSLAGALGIAFELDSKTRERYQKYGIDLAKSSGESHYQLPAPAVYIVNKEGLIQFSYINPNYKVRLTADLLLAAAKSFIEVE